METFIFFFSSNRGTWVRGSLFGRGQLGALLELTKSVNVFQNLKGSTQYAQSL